MAYWNARVLFTSPQSLAALDAVVEHAEWLPGRIRSSLLVDACLHQHGRLSNMISTPHSHRTVISVHGTNVKQNLQTQRALPLPSKSDGGSPAQKWPFSRFKHDRTTVPLPAYHCLQPPKVVPQCLPSLSERSTYPSPPSPSSSLQP